MTETQILVLILVIVFYITLPLLCAFAARNGMAVRETEVRRQLKQVEAERFELGRQAHDLKSMIALHQWAIENDDTTMSRLAWDDLPTSSS